MVDEGQLGEFEEFVLLALIRVGDDVSAVDARREIEKRTERTVSDGAVYSTLNRLEDKGYVASSKERSDESGRRRRTYTISEPGRRALRRTRDQRESMWEDVEV